MSYKKEIHQKKAEALPDKSCHVFLEKDRMAILYNNLGMKDTRPDSAVAAVRRYNIDSIHDELNMAPHPCRTYKDR